MSNMLKLYKIMLRYWVYLLLGLLCIVGYALFSGVNVTMLVPMFDNVFFEGKEIPIYTDSSSLWNAVSGVFSRFWEQTNGAEFFQVDSWKTMAESLSSLLQKADSFLLLQLISGLIIGLMVFKNFFFYGNQLMFANLQGKTVKDIRNKMFHTYLFQSLAFFGKNKTGDALVRMVSDAEIVSNQLIKKLFLVIQNIMLLVVYAIIALAMNSFLFLVSVLLFPAFSLLITFVGKKIKKYAKRIQNKSSDMFSNVEEVLGNMRIVKAFSREKYEYGKFREINHKYFLFWRKSIIYSSLNTPIAEISSTMIGVVVMLVGGRQVLNPEAGFTIGQFTAFLFALFSMLHPLKQLTKAYAEIRKALVSLDRIYYILDQQSEIQELEQPNEKADFVSEITYQNVSFSYVADSLVLKNVDFSIYKGEQVAFVGGSGSGKTTIMNLLLRMYDANSGQILIDGVPIASMRMQNLRRLFGTVTQESILFSDTITNNIAYGTLDKVDADQIALAANIAYADEFIDQLPKRYDEMLDIKAANLSGGQKQRLCIARAIVGNPPILIFDEATSALDTEAERKVQQAIEKATQNRTVLLIAHRLSTVLASDKIIVLDKGSIVGIGKHAELLETCPRYRRLYELQFEDS